MYIYISFRLHSYVNYPKHGAKQSLGKQNHKSPYDNIYTDQWRRTPSIPKPTSPKIRDGLNDPYH